MKDVVAQIIQLSNSILSKKEEIYPEVRGWVKVEDEEIAEYARGKHSLVIDKDNGKWTLSTGNRTVDAGRGMSPKKSSKMISQLQQKYNLERKF